MNAATFSTAVPSPFPSSSGRSGPAAWEFKVADCEEEFEAVHRLNHRTFAEEIPQHEPNPERRLVDRFHGRNRYVIALRNREREPERGLAGMVCLRLDRPFSLDQKIPEEMATLPAGRSWCEIRLLALDPRERGGALLAGLLRALIHEVASQGCDAAVISATTRQLKLYRHLGFTPFGRLVGREGAWYQPMWILMETLLRAVPVLAAGTQGGRKAARTGIGGETSIEVASLCGGGFAKGS